MKQKILLQLSFCLFGFFITFFFIHSHALAVTVNINQYPQTITQDPFTVSASISGATNGTNYVRVDIYKEGSTNYFGETYNGADWYSGSDYHQYLPIIIANGQWTGTIQGSLGSPSTSEYDGMGAYRIRLRRYTGGGTTNATEADNSSVSITIVVPTPTPTPTNTPTPNPTSPPTATPKPTVTPTPVPTTKSSPSPSISHILAIATDSADASKEGDLSASDEATLSPTSLQKVAGVHTSVLPNMLLIIAGVMVIGCGILFSYKFRKQKDGQDSNDE